MTRIVRYAPQLMGWPDAMGLRIAVLTDCHSNWPWMTPRRLHAICAEANALSADIVVLLGDYAPGPRFSVRVAPHAWADALGTLLAPLGVHAVLGNHDYEGYSRADLLGRTTAAEDALSRAGISVYENRAIRLETGRGAFWLAGLGDQYAFGPARAWRPDRQIGLDDVPATLAQVDTDDPVILMAHEPDIFPDLPDRVALTLSGHTHAGQVKLFGKTPVVPSRHGSRYVYGHYFEGQRHLIVSAGLGYSGLPIRFGTAPEIVLVEMGKRT